MSPGRTTTCPSISTARRNTFRALPPDRVMPVNVPTLRALKKAVQRDQVPHDEFPHSVHPIRKRSIARAGYIRGWPRRASCINPCPVKRRDPSASFDLSSLRNRTSLRRRPLDERRDALASELKGDSKSDRAQHGGPEEGVPEPGQPELRIERAGNGQHQGQAKREAEALGGLDQPRGEALFPGFRPGEARDGECWESDARPERPENRPRQDAEIARGDRGS